MCSALAATAYECYGGTGSPGPRDPLAGVGLPLRVPTGEESRGLTTTQLGSTGWSLREGRGPAHPGVPSPGCRCSGSPFLSQLVQRSGPCPGGGRGETGRVHSPEAGSCEHEPCVHRTHRGRSGNLPEQRRAPALKPPRLRPRQDPPPPPHWLCLSCRGGACGTPGA